MAETEDRQDNQIPEAGGPGPDAEDPYNKPGAVTRRRFLTITFAGATAIGLGALVAPLARYAYPILKPEVFERLQVAQLSSLTPLGPGVNFDYQDIPAQLIMLEDGTPAAYSLICTHLGCIVKWVPRDGEFECPCHAGKFAANGDVVSGPPPRPLDKLKVETEGDNVFITGIEPEAE